jgi:hypothetical protein
MGSLQASDDGKERKMDKVEAEELAREWAA